MYLEGLVRKYLANAVLNKIMCAYVINNLLLVLMHLKNTRLRLTTCVVGNIPVWLNLP